MPSSLVPKAFQIVSCVYASALYCTYDPLSQRNGIRDIVSQSLSEKRLYTLIRESQQEMVSIDY